MSQMTPEGELTSMSPRESTRHSEFQDMLIIGAGLSGIGAACRYRTNYPNDKMVVLETRSAMGGTWDLFRYPGIRSDSDMLTFGYEFRPWVGEKMLADGASIRNYIETVADEFGVTPFIQFNSKVTSMKFNTAVDLWEVTVENTQTGDKKVLRSRFVISAAGYYNYDEGYKPHFEGRDRFKGEILHPQHWPEDYDVRGKRIIVVGSGATAVTLLPELAYDAEHVIMLQRSPTYIASVPGIDEFGNLMRKFLPSKIAYRVGRAKNIFLMRQRYKAARKDPQKAREWFRNHIQEWLGEDYPINKHFNPDYDPWDQRVCRIPDGDLFEAIKDGRASVVTDHIDTFTEDGVLLKSGDELKADLIITATGLNLEFNGGAQFSIDGSLLNIADCFGYKGIMYSGLPNLVTVFGYTNASWTLRADLISQYAIRLVEYMKSRNLTRATPIAPKGMSKQNWIDFEAGYFQRSMNKLPHQGDRDPWRNDQEYEKDKVILLKEAIDDGTLHFSSAPKGEVSIA